MVLIEGGGGSHGISVSGTERGGGGGMERDVCDKEGRVMFRVPNQSSAGNRTALFSSGEKTKGRAQEEGRKRRETRSARTKQH